MTVTTERTASDPGIAFAEGLGVMMLANGNPCRNRNLFRFDTENGKIKRIREYLNPITAALSFGIPLPLPQQGHRSAIKFLYA